MLNGELLVAIITLTFYFCSRKYKLGEAGAAVRSDIFNLKNNKRDPAIVII